MCETHHGADCGCGHERGTTHAHHFGSGRTNCGCCDPSFGHAERGREVETGGVGFRRRFPNRSERIDELTEYLKALDAEAQGVREHLDDLRSQGSAD